MGKSGNGSKISLRPGARTCLIFGAVLLLSACTHDAAPALATPAPVVGETPAPETYTPNPIAAFYSVFYADYAAELEEMEAHAQTHPEWTESILDVRMMMQRLQMVFSPVQVLQQSEEGLWDGLLLGAISGTGSVQGDELEATFSCSLYSKDRIQGSLVDHQLSGTWEQYHQTEQPLYDEEGEITGYVVEYLPLYQAVICREGEAWLAWVWHEGVYGALYVAMGEAWFAKELPTPPRNAEEFAAGGADWHYGENGFFKIIKNDEANMEGETENEA